MRRMPLSICSRPPRPFGPCTLAFEGDPKRRHRARSAGLALLPEDNLDPRPFRCHLSGAGLRGRRQPRGGDRGLRQGRGLWAEPPATITSRLARWRPTPTWNWREGHLREADDVLQRALGYAAEHGS